MISSRNSRDLLTTQWGGHKPHWLARFWVVQEKIADDVQTLKPSTLRDTIELARMRDDRLTRQQCSDNSDNFIPTAKQFQLQPLTILDVPLNPVPNVPLNWQATSANHALKKLSWEEM